MPEERCEEQAKFADAVVDAIAKVSQAKGGLDSIKDSKADPGPYITALHNARAAERRAVAVLDNHKKEHGCGNVSG